MFFYTKVLRSTGEGKNNYYTDLFIVLITELMDPEKPPDNK